MTGLEVLALTLGLFLLSQLVAIPLGAAIGKRVGAGRWLAIFVAIIALGIIGVMIVSGKS